jgi:hypothetical protein
MANVNIVFRMNCWKKKQAKESVSQKPKFKNYEVTSVTMLPQTLRYLPISVAYPAEYGVKDIKDTHTKLDDAEGEQMETNRIDIYWSSSLSTFDRVLLLSSLS